MKLNEVPSTFIEILRTTSDIDLVVLQHELRRHATDQLFLEAVLDELSDRQKQRGSTGSPEGDA